MIETTYAFVDAYGDTDLEVQKSGATTHFIVSAVLVRGDKSEVEGLAQDIRQRHFQTGEMKSSGIGANDQRRLDILSEICELPLRTFTIAVDKSELNKSKGLANKRSFFKYVHRMLFDRIHRAFANTVVIADEHGGLEFMKGFRDYFDRVLPPDLFTRLEFRFARSHDEVLLQVADIISGSIARCVDPKKDTPASSVIMEKVTKISLGIHVWPWRQAKGPLAGEIPSNGDNQDVLVRCHCLRQVELFFSEHVGRSSDDEELCAQMAVLEYLLFKVVYVDDKSFVTTDELISHLSDALGIEMTGFQMRATVISQLRDAGVIVASGREGYKLPVRVKDLAEFVGHAQSIIPPMLGRLRRAQVDLRLASMGELDILSSPEVDYLRRLVDVHETDG